MQLEQRKHHRIRELKGARRKVREVSATKQAEPLVNMPTKTHQERYEFKEPSAVKEEQLF